MQLILERSNAVIDCDGVGNAERNVVEAAKDVRLDGAPQIANETEAIDVEKF